MYTCTLTAALYCGLYNVNGKFYYSSNTSLLNLCVIVANTFHIHFCQRQTQENIKHISSVGPSDNFLSIQSSVAICSDSHRPNLIKTSMKIHMTYVSGCGYLWSCPYLRPLSPLPLSPSHFIHCFGLSLKSKPEKTRECFNFEKYSAFFVSKGISHNEEKEEVGNTY